MNPYAPPRFSLRFWPVWRRNFLVWNKLAIPSLLGNLADPMLYMLGLGYGLGSLLPSIDGVPYLHFLAAGTLCYSTMNSATFEALYSAFSRMQVQRSWDAILNAAMDLDDILMGEWLWAASKSLVSGAAILVVVLLLGLAEPQVALWLLPLALLVGLTFSALGLAVTAVSPSYDFFMYYFSLVISPMVLLCGVFYPTSQLPSWLQAVSNALPLTQAIDIARPLLLGQPLVDPWSKIAIMAAYTLIAYYLAVVLTRRRLLR